MSNILKRKPTELNENEVLAKTAKPNETENCFFYLSKINTEEHLEKLNFKFSISLSEILSIDKEDFVESAQFTYLYDKKWLVKQYPSENRNHPLTLITGQEVKHDENNNELNDEDISSTYENIRIIETKVGKFGVHHTKMMFLLYTTGIRIVVLTANLYEKEWSKKTQGIWISDLFPKVPEHLQNKPHLTDSKTKFKQYLLTYLDYYRESKLQSWIDHIRNHDMTRANVYLIASVPCTLPTYKEIFGYPRLRKVLKDNLSKREDKNGRSSEQDNIVCQFTSIGSLGPDENSWLIDEFLNSLADNSNKTCDFNDNIKPICIFPSVENVQTSYEGLIAGQSISYSKSNSLKQSYLKRFFYKWSAEATGRTKASPHIKSFAKYSNDFSKLYWFLLTSANLSKAAWGFRFYDQSSQDDIKLRINSFEMGVLFMPQLVEDNQKDYFDLKLNEEFLIPYDIPPKKYESTDSPWTSG